MISKVVVLVGLALLSTVAIVQAGCCGCHQGQSSGTKSASRGSSGRCDAGWTYREDKCYKLIFPAVPSVGAVTKGLCAPLGAHAVHIMSQAENDWVVDYAYKEIQAVGKAGNPLLNWVVLGATKAPDGSLSWDSSGLGSNCPITYSSWAPNEPRGDGGTVLLKVDAGATTFWGAGPSGDGFRGKWDDIKDDWARDDPTVCVKAANGSPLNAASCDYKPPPSPPPCPCQCNCRQACCCQGGC